MFIQLGRWGASSPFFDQEHRLSVTSAVLSQRTMFRPEATAGVQLSIELLLDEHRFHAQVDDGSLRIDRAPKTSADATLATDPKTLASLLYGGERLQMPSAQVRPSSRATQPRSNNMRRSSGFHSRHQRPTIIRIDPDATNIRIRHEEEEEKK